MIVFLVVVLVVELIAALLILRGFVRSYRGKNFSGMSQFHAGLMCALALLLLPAFFNLAVNLNAYGAKVGRVVDSTTGVGLSNVVVVAQAEFSVVRIEGGGGAEIYRFATHTDEHGYYSIPSAWMRAPVWLPPYIFSSAPSVSWKLDAFSVGYVNPLDRMNPDVSPRHERFGRYVSSPSAVWLGVVTRMSTIELTQLDLTIVEASSYYASAAAGTDQFEDIRPIFALMKEKACAQEPSSNIDYWTVMDLRRLQPSDQAFMGKLYALEPDARDARAEDHPQFLAQNVCAGLKAAG